MSALVRVPVADVAPVIRGWSIGANPPTAEVHEVHAPGWQLLRLAPADPGRGLPVVEVWQKWLRCATCGQTATAQLPGDARQWERVQVGHRLVRDLHPDPGPIR